MKKNCLFTIVIILSSLLLIEGILRTVKLIKNISRQSKTEWAYSDTEKALIEAQKERMKSSVILGFSAKVSPEMYIIKDNGLYYPYPNTTLVILINERVGYMQVLLNERNRDLLKTFEGDTFYSNYDELSLRKTSSPSGTTFSNPIKVLMLSDSFEGILVNDEETFSSNIQKLANDDSYPLKIYNAGISGYDTKNEYDRLLELLPQIEPQVVVLNHFPNDIRVIEQKVVGCWKPTKPQNPTGEWVNDNILIAKAVIRGFYSLFANYEDPERNKAITDGWNRSLYYLNEIKKECDRRGIRFLISAIPPKEQFECDNKKYYQDKLKDFCLRNNIQFLDPYEYIKSNIPERLYFSWDPHFNEQGHKAYARFLYENIPQTKRGNR